MRRTSESCTGRTVPRAALETRLRRSLVASATDTSTLRHHSAQHVEHKSFIHRRPALVLHRCSQATGRAEVLCQTRLSVAGQLGASSPSRPLRLPLRLPQDAVNPIKAQLPSHALVAGGLRSATPNGVPVSVVHAQCARGERGAGGRAWKSSMETTKQLAARTAFARTSGAALAPV